MRLGFLSRRAIAIGLLVGMGAVSSSAMAAADPTVAKAILMRSIAIPTVEGRGQVPKLAAYYASVLKDAGFQPGEIEIAPIGETATLAATLKGSTDAKPILMIGHMDVVEAKASDWERDPFVPVEENGYIYGRGSYDNKYDVAMMVATMAQLKRDGFVPRRSLILLLSGDEETHMVTARALAKKYANAEMLLNGDGGGGLLGEDGKPAFYRIQAGEKSYVDFEVVVTDPGGHSSRPGKVNAIYELSAALDRLSKYAFPPQINELTKAVLTAASKEVGGELGAAMARFVKNPADTAAADIISAYPEFIGQVRTTCVPTMATAGHALNALPQRASVSINCRIFPGVSIESVQAALKKAMDDPNAKFTILGNPAASDASPLRPDVVAAVTKAVHANYPGVEIMPEMSNGATDSMFFRAIGIPSYGVGTVFIKASDDFTHGLNERVPSGAIKASLDQWDSVLRDLSR